MGKTPRLEIGNLHWVYSKTTGSVPFMFNNNFTSIKLLYENYGFPILVLPADPDNHTVSKRLDDACLAIGDYFHDEFEFVPTLDVFDSSYSTFIQNWKIDMACGTHNLTFTQKDIEKMRVKFNKHMHRQQQIRDEFSKALKEQEAEQQALRDF